LGAKGKFFPVLDKTHCDACVNCRIDRCKLHKKSTLRRLSSKGRNWSVAKWQFSCSESLHQIFFLTLFFPLYPHSSVVYMVHLKNLFAEILWWWSMVTQSWKWENLYSSESPQWQNNDIECILMSDWNGGKRVGRNTSNIVTG
jgi:hypothetical protein